MEPASAPTGLAVATPPPTWAIPIFNLFEGRKGNGGDQWTVKCPTHRDTVASLRFTADDEKIALQCKAGCPTEGVMQAIGLELADVYRVNFEKRKGNGHSNNGATGDPLPFRDKRKPDKPEGKHVDTYQYGDGNGTVLAEKGRFELDELGPDGKPKKTFLWRTPGSERWNGMGGLATAQLALWGTEIIRTAPPDQWVYYVEGERAAMACRAAGLLAVTHAGGASTREFGDALEVLRGRKVALWPDNDGPGREYMAAVHARLRGLAAEIRVVAVPLPVKGDAVEWFGGGGTVAQLEAGALELTGSSVEYFGADHLRIGYPVAMGAGVITFDFDEMERNRLALDTELTITIQAPGADRTPHSDRINLMSASARTELRRDLENIYGKDWGWTKALNTVFSLARDRFLAYDRSIDAYDLIPVEDADLFFHDPLVPRDQVTILFGSRESGKTYVALSLAYCAAMGEPFLGKRMPQGPVLFVDYEDNPANFRRRLDRVAAGLDLPVLPGIVHYLPASGMAFTDLKKAVKRLIVEHGILLVVMDSIGPATSGKPEDAQSAMALMQAFRWLEITVLALGHIPKNGGLEQPSDPFGSIFYSNLSRGLIYIEKAQEEASDTLIVGLYNKKLSDGARWRPLALELAFSGRSGPVTITEQGIATVPELQKRREVKYQIWDALDHGNRMTVARMAEVLDIKDATVSKTLKNNPHLFVVAGEDDSSGGRRAQLWGRAASRTA